MLEGIDILELVREEFAKGSPQVDRGQQERVGGESQYKRQYSDHREHWW